MLRSTHRNQAIGMRNATTRRALRGMGDVSCDADGNCYDSGSGDYTPAPVDLPVYSGGASPSAQALQLSPQFMTGPSVALNNPALQIDSSSNPSGSGASLLNTLVSSAASVAAPLVRAATQQAPYYITNPATGQSALYNPNTGTFAGASATLGSMSPTTLLIGAAVIGALFLMGGKK